jgi:hypothetical protein
MRAGLNRAARRVVLGPSQLGVAPLLTTSTHSTGSYRPKGRRQCPNRKKPGDLARSFGDPRARRLRKARTASVCQSSSGPSCARHRGFSRALPAPVSLVYAAFRCRTPARRSSRQNLGARWTRPEEVLARNAGTRIDRQDGDAVGRPSSTILLQRQPAADQNECKRGDGREDEQGGRRQDGRREDG